MISTEQLRKTIEECMQKRPSGQSVVFTSKFVEELARELLANREARPMAQVAENFIFILRDQDNGERWPVDTKLYAAPPEAAIQADVEAVVGLLESGEWAEHCTNTELGQRLESAVTALMTDAPSVPEVSGE
ncbi:hypothetical protein QOM18_21200 [Serratia marcescens]|uniref:hypothetical protein n=1 Tax=Serratia marcescens TaxID=615 RepID=UPI0024C485F9|nr:hypothetical protein [Serratia marcescens]MDK1710825.1 hypothetical protein [Serratia marcescens]